MVTLMQDPFPNMQLRSLTENDSDILLNAINGAFADYIVPFQLNKAQLQFKIATEHILPECSVGIFEAGQLLAFMLHGIRTIAGNAIAYNAGTGVLPAYRGKDFVRQMYDYILPVLKAHRAKQVVLEVIESNRPAIHAYKKNGFSIRRKLLCFGGEIRSATDSEIAIVRPLPEFSREVFQSFWDISPSWQQDIPAMDIAKPQALGAFINEVLVGYVLFCTDKKKVFQLAVAHEHRRKGIGTLLFAALQQQVVHEKVRMNNVDAAATGFKLFLEKQGLINDVNQFEMVKNLE